MTKKHHKIYDIILKIIATTYLSEFLAYIGIDKNIVENLKTEITTLSGRTVYLDFLCKTNDNKLRNIEFQLNDPQSEDLERFYNYNIITTVRHDKTTESMIVTLKRNKTRVKEIKVGKSIDFHPDFFHLANINYDKILNNIENKVKDNDSLTSFEEMSLMIISLLPKYKNKTTMLKRIFNLLEYKNCFNEKKFNIIEGVIQLEIERFIPKNKLNEFEREIDMTPETQAIFKQAIEETNQKWIQIEKDEARKEGKIEGLKEGKIEGLKEGEAKGIEKVAKNLKKIHNDTEICELTGLSLKTVQNL